MADFSTDDDKGQYEGPGAPERLGTGMDIGQVFKFPFQDEAWFKKVAIMGLIGLIPIVGAINMLGWIKECYENKKRDENVLPEAGFQHLQTGAPFFLALLVPLAASFVVNLVAGLINVKVIGFLLSSVAGLFGLTITVLIPAVMYIYVRDEDKMGALNIEKMKGVILDSGIVPYLMLVAAFLIAGFVSWLGTLVFCVGAIFSAPLGAAMVGAALAEFSREMTDVENG